jgi:hypothetical protein
LHELAIDPHFSPNPALTRLRRSIVACIFVSLAIFISKARGQQTIQVPENAATVQDAIDMASDGDTVNIAPGTYGGAINFNGKSITVQGSGPGVILEGHPDSPVVTFNSGETRSAVLQNVTVTGGSVSAAPSAGGIYINGASPTIQNSTITGNLNCDIGVVNGAPAILDNEISSSVLALYVTGCIPLSERAGDEYGGGVLLYGPSKDGLEAQIIGNIIEDNQVVYGAGGINVIDAGLLLIKNNVIRGNFTNAAGAGINVEGDTAPSIVQNLIYGNTIDPILIPPSYEVGAGITIAVTTGEFEAAPVLVVNNTLVGNQLLFYPSAPQQGSQFFADNQTQRIELINNLIIGSTSQAAVYCQVDPAHPVAPPSFVDNDVYNLDSAGGAAYSGTCPSQTGIFGNISADPLFATGAGDAHPYELLVASPAIDAGDNEAEDLPALDLVGNPRVQNAKGLSTAIVDMGVYEYVGVPAPPPPPANFTLTVTPSAIGVQEGKRVNLSVSVSPVTANLGPVTLTCTGLPANAACSFAPLLLVFTSTQPQSSALTITTGTATGRSSGAPSMKGNGSLALTALMLLPFVIVFSRDSATSKPDAGFRCLSFLCVLWLTFGLSGCGKDKYVVYVPPQTYAVTVQAVAVNSNLTKQAVVVLTVDH